MSVLRFDLSPAAPVPTFFILVYPWHSIMYLSTVTKPSLTHDNVCEDRIGIGFK